MRIDDIKHTVGNFNNSFSSFPIDIQTFAGLQDQNRLALMLGNMGAGDGNYWISGGVKTGAQRSAGYAFVHTNLYPQGEVLYYGGGTSDTAYVTQTVVNVGNVNSAYYVRCLTEGIGSEEVDLADYDENDHPRGMRTINPLAMLTERLAELEVQVNNIRSEEIGTIKIWAGDANHAPSEGGTWLLCNGQDFPTTDYPMLFEKIGTAFNTSATPTGRYALPNLVGRVPVGQQTSDADFGTLGKQVGEAYVTLKAEQIPPHSHQLPMGSWQKPYPEGSGFYWGGMNDSRQYTDSTGGGQPHNNIQPSTVVNFYIKAAN